MLIEQKEELFEALRDFERSATFIRNFAKQNNLGRQDVSIVFFGKIILPSPVKGKIIKIDSRNETFKRIAFCREAEKRGIDLFVKPQIKIDTDFFIVTEEEQLCELWIPEDCDRIKIEKTPSIDQMSNSFEAKFITHRICSDYPEKFFQIQKLFQEYKVGWFGINNVGLAQNGKIKIFDFVADIAANEGGDLYDPKN